ncbi:multidrug resistance protein [Verticillium alfalfae VaMs.102]|uniref:Multidrug resistance protein n=1 Tax=Verticillium alfalfae (strain VaMs.102 / ATCC MYA-4576 / FGSC 10136) TaxID=526221 RepID=C9SDX7_VERA1|nr:multidrug resistance protein [Verticillium alfalfae VaMs.102]EEY16463.1 multidrug resistance protein [Verticillium alfalfae VaMs.102]
MSNPPPEKPIASGTASSQGDSTEIEAHSHTNEKAATDKNDLEKADSKVATPPEAASQEDPFKHLPDDEAAVLKRQIITPEVKAGVAALYRYSSTNDIIIIIISTLCAIAAGAALPLMTVIFGNLQNVFQDYFVHRNMSHDDFTDELAKLVLYFVYLAIGEFVVSYISTVGFIYTGEHISAQIRIHYLESCMRQNIGFFDNLGSGEVTTRITADTNLIQDGMSEKVSLTIAALATFIAAFVIGFIFYWKLTLILFSTVVALVLVMGGGSTFIMKFNKQSIDSYAQGGSLADEVISSIRNAIAFGTQDRLAKQYDVHLVKAEFFGFRVKGAIGCMVAAVAAAAKIYNTIDRVSPLDPSLDTGDRLEKLEGTITLKGIKHIYPSRPEVVVMQDVSLTIPAGKTTALVGASGSGKSTIVGLVERFYDPVQGSVYLDGHDIAKLNLRWLRQQMALVSQEPTLFGTTIFHNIRHGLIGTQHENESEEKLRELVIGAAKKANAHDFITSLPEGYETNVGERGFLLSGGQKQRIAIARAIVSDPKILLLDEATSALDTKSEGVVQAALEVAAEGRTTITIAHRLSTIRDAHNIVVMSEGRIVEQGTHDELLELNAAYYNLVTAQNIAAVNEMTPEEAAAIDEKDEQLIRQASRSKEGYVHDPQDDINLNRTTTTKSASSVALQGKQPEPEKKYGLWTLIKLIGSFNKKEVHFMLIGLIFSIICGGGNPTTAVFFAKQIVTLIVPVTDENRDQIKSDSDFWSLMYLMLALVQLLAFATQGILFAKCSERLVHRVRDRAFRTMLRQDVAFFDKDENTAGALTSFLSTETTHVAGLSGVTLGTLLMVTTTLVAALALSIAIGWKLALVLRIRPRRASPPEDISAIRTVASLTREQDVLDMYKKSLAEQQRRSLRSVLKSSSLYAGSQSLTFLAFALGFWYGGTLIASREYNMFQFFVCFSAIIFGAQSAGSIFSFAPDMGKAHQAAGELKTLFDRKPTIDTWSTEGESLESVDGTLEFRDVHFRYPTRPEQPVLRGLNLTVRPGQYIALVGASGCGKSTTIALLERFYDPLAGGIYIDGKEISTLNVNNYRSFIALVSQEPTLYQGSIRENILLGTPHEATDEAIEFACREANIYDFIVSLPDGFNTVVGSKGALLSGGQKQRIAIARALIRDPKILLLDEATSALDSESEHVVQAALDKAAKGRTTIAVAHRLSTIQKADVIYVFDQGRIVEQGTHTELMRANGRYAELVNLQSLEKHA